MTVHHHFLKGEGGGIKDTQLYKRKENRPVVRAGVIFLMITFFQAQKFHAGCKIAWVIASILNVFWALPNKTGYITDYGPNLRTCLSLFLFGRCGYECPGLGVQQ